MRIVHRDPDTGRFITREAWEKLQEKELDYFDDWEDFSEFESFDEMEVY